MTREASHESARGGWRAAAAAQPGRRVRIDTGLFGRVTAAGELRFYVTVWQGGRQQMRVQPAGTTEKQARQIALRARAAAGDGQAPIAAALRFADLADRYLEQADVRTRISGKGRMSERTVELYRQRLADYVTPVIGRRKLSQLGAGDVLRVIDGCQAANLADWTIHGVLVALRAALQFGRERDLMTGDPFARVPRDRLPAQRPRSDPRAVRPEDAALWLEQLRRKPTLGRRDVVLGCLLVHAGLRVSEAIAVTWADIRLGEGELDVRGQLARTKRGEPPRIIPTKSDRGVRTVTLLPRLQQALEELYAGEDDHEFVLHTRLGTPLSRENAARTVRGAAVAAGLGSLGPHVLRRTLGTALSEANTPEAAAAQMLGHSTRVYHGNYVKSHRDRLERELLRDALVAHGLGVAEGDATAARRGGSSRRQAAVRSAASHILVSYGSAEAPADERLGAERLIRRDPLTGDKDGHAGVAVVDRETT